ncbi:unnamed protein product [Pieris macdunnoughi]|uniref:Uncharacterized protein n=1 Tax=Pieris macdunnoughi TaxID=345717 RepID=A0A821UXS7_9NEOP|nr:unnamed protein product [Pieris macdunnoughi]
MPDIRFYDNMLFNYETTNRTYFQPEIINYYPPTLYQEKVTRPRPAYKPLKNIHTLTEFKKHDLPTELFANQKQIIRKDARKVHSTGIVSFLICNYILPYALARLECAHLYHISALFQSLSQWKKIVFLSIFLVGLT